MNSTEESIQETLRAQDEYLATWDSRWRERVASQFASLIDASEHLEPIHTPNRDAAPALEA